VRYVPPAEFEDLRRAGYEMGFAHVESGPLVRSSYHAADSVPPSVGQDGILRADC
jgi:lipoic acid synthetase